MALTREQNYRRIARPLTFIVCAAPLIWLAVKAGVSLHNPYGELSKILGSLGANPIEYINRYLGDWALRVLIITLAMSPLQHISGWSWPGRVRRMVGLFAFAYATLHIASYVGLDRFFAWPEIWADIIKRKYITVGMLTFLMLVPLAITSTNAMLKRLGHKRWKKLHRLVYLAGIGACLHYIWMVKADLLLPTLHSAALALLLAYRIVRAVKRR